MQLSLRNVPIDYAVQFLFDRNTRLSGWTNLSIKYETLAAMANNFTNNAILLNCTKIKCLDIYGPFVHAENFHFYFPLLLILVFVKIVSIKRNTMRKLTTF